MNLTIPVTKKEISDKTVDDLNKLSNILLKKILSGGKRTLRKKNKKRVTIKKH